MPANSFDFESEMVTSANALAATSNVPNVLDDHSAYNIAMELMHSSESRQLMSSLAPNMHSDQQQQLVAGLPGMHSEANSQLVSGLSGLQPDASHLMGGMPPSIDGINEAFFSLSDADRANKRSQNMTECVAVPSSEHVAEIVGRQGKLYILVAYN